MVPLLEHLAENTHHGTSVVEPVRRGPLPSGRSVVLRVAEDGEELEVRSPHGEVEVRITLNAQGAVVSLRGSRLELEAPETVAINCGRFEVCAAEAMQLHTAGNVHISGHAMQLKTEGDMHMNGGIIHLNC
jgi:hypothetical protein